MRTILFRGKQLGTGEWVKGSLIISGLSCFILSLEDGAIAKNSGTYGYWSINKPCSEVDPETVGQFTGLLDKNGKKIFEGDALKIDAFKGVVTYSEQYSQWLVSGIAISFFRREIEIIGNIHDK